MPLTTTTGTIPVAPIGRSDRGFQYVLYESNLFDKDLHPITGISTPGVHTRVRTFRQAKGRSTSYVLNRPGSTKINLPLVSDEALDVVGHELTRCIIIFMTPDDPSQDPTPIWGGYISSVELDSDSASVAVTFTGWLQFIYSGEFRQPYFFNSMDAGVIGSRLLGTLNNRIANDNVVTGSGGKSAEDLLYGAGELDSLTNVSGATNLDATYPLVTSSWDFTSGILPSGAGGIQLQATNKNTISYVRVGAPFPVDASSNYNFRALVRVVSRTGTSDARLYVNWLDGSGATISSNFAATTTIGTQEINVVMTSPVGAVQAAAYIMLSTGTTGFVNAIFDSFYVSKNDVKLRPTPLRLGVVDSPANPSGANRTRTYQLGDKIGNGIEELSNIESGYDMQVRMEKNTISGGVTYLRKLDLKWTQVKAATSIYGIGSDRTDVIFGHKWGPNNLSSMRETRDGGSMGNRITGRATGATAMAQDTSSIDTYNLWEDSVNISDPGIDANILLGYAGSEVVYRSMPTRRFNPQPFPYDGTSKVPKVFEDFDLGDIVYTVADDGALQVGRDVSGKQPIRVFGFTFALDEENNERFSSLQTTMGGG